MNAVTTVLPLQNVDFFYDPLPLFLQVVTLLEIGDFLVFCNFSSSIASISNQITHYH